MADVQYRRYVPDRAILPPQELLSKSGQNVKVTPLGSQQTNGHALQKELEVNTIDDVSKSDQLFGSKRKLKVVVIGAGVSGLNFFKRAEEQGENLEIVCYEKNSDIGGTWLENRYPGCACKLPSATVFSANSP